jgi:glycosyltransferase involved in cell wall biosynthesis
MFDWSWAVGHSNVETATLGCKLSRILLIIPTLDRGGAAKQLALLACGLKARGWDVHVCCLTRGGAWQETLAAASVPVTIIGKPWKLDPLAYFRLRRFIAELKPDLVHTWLFAANSYGRLAALSAGVKHVVAGERCADPWKRAWQLQIDRYLARRTERIVTNSAGVVEFYAQKGLPREKFAVISNGIEPHEPQASTSREDLLKELNLPAGARLIGAVGRLWPQKRYKDLIWAMDLLRCVHDNVYLLIVGNGPQRWRLERYASQVADEDVIQFLGERDDVPRILPHLSCFWLGSAYEGQSNAIMEAMSAGLPVVASDIPGNRDLVVDGETGFLVRLGDRAGFAARTSELLKNPEFAQRLGDASQQRVEREFSVARMIDRHEELYRSLLGSHGS